MKKRFAALDATVIILSAACIALCVALALVKPTYLVFVVGVLLVVGIVVGLNIRWSGTGWRVCCTALRMHPARRREVLPP